MLKAHWRLISYLERIGDNLLICLAFFLTYYLRDFIISLGILKNLYLANLNIAGEFLALGPIESYFVVLGIALPTYNACLSLFGAYRSMRFQQYLEVFRTTVLTSFIVFLCEGSFLFLLKLDLSRSFVGIFCALSGVFLFVERALVLLSLRYYRIRGKNYRNILIVGTGEQGRALFREITNQKDLGIRIIGFASLDDKANSSAYDLPAKVVATPRTFEAALKSFTVDEVLFTDVLSGGKPVQDLAQIAVEEGVRVSFAADLFSLEIFQSEVSFFSGIPVVHYHPSRGGSDSVQLVLKRVFDVGAAGVILVLVSPIMLIAAAAIKLESKGPIFYKPRRVGLNGRVFTLLKFRSMIVDADKLLDDLRDKNEMTGPAFKMSNDPRLTSVGAFLRRFSIDELPQLINVIAGDMSLVGPRPPLPNEVMLYERKHRRRLSMRPGLTCTWQVSGRNNIPDFDEWTKLDLEYIDNWSLMRDFSLLLRTIPAVLCGTGAR